jgi:hypothetical protein
MQTIQEIPTSEELKEVAERIIQEAEPSRDVMIVVGTIFECIALRNAIDHVLKTCTDIQTVAYLRDMRDKMRNKSKH